MTAGIVVSIEMPIYSGVCWWIKYCAHRDGLVQLIGLSGSGATGFCCSSSQAAPKSSKLGNTAVYPTVELIGLLGPPKLRLPTRAIDAPTRSAKAACIATASSIVAPLSSQNVDADAVNGGMGAPDSGVANRTLDIAMLSLHVAKGAIPRTPFRPAWLRKKFPRFSTMSA